MKYSISLADVKQICSKILNHYKLSDAHTSIIIDSVVYAHGRGRGTHGLARFPIYVKKIENGLLNPNTPIDIVRERKAIAVLDANHGFGQVAAIEAANIAIGKAQKYGVSAVSVKRSNNFGTVGFVTEYAAKQGMMTMVFSNASPAIAPAGGAKPLLGTNPLGIAFPAGHSGLMISLDMATSAVARGKIRQAAKNGEKIPLGWALDSNGHPTDDPFAALKGSMVALGDYKGYGLSLCIDVMAGLISGAAFAGEVLPLASEHGFSNYGHLIIALNTDFFIEPEDYRAGIDKLVKAVKATSNQAEVVVPGERNRSYDDSTIIEIPERLRSELDALLNKIETVEG